MKNTPTMAASAAMLTLLALAAGAAHAGPGLRVAKDPVTGQLRAPTAEEAAALNAPAANDGKSRTLAVSTGKRGLITGTVNPQVIAHDDGTEQLELTEDSQSFSVARRNSDGSITMNCVTGPKAAAQAMKSGKRTAKISQEHKHAADK